jgi:hypothetical protein
MEIKLKAKSVYGKVLVYPVCEKSNLLIRLTGKKTFDDTDMFVLERLGYSVSWEAEMSTFNERTLAIRGIGIAGGCISMTYIKSRNIMKTDLYLDYLPH